MNGSARFTRETRVLTDDEQAVRAELASAHAFGSHAWDAVDDCPGCEVRTRRQNAQK